MGICLWLRELKLGLCNNLEGGRWVGGSRGRGHVYCGWFMLTFDRNQHNTVKQLSFNLKIYKYILKKENPQSHVIINLHKYVTQCTIHHRWGRQWWAHICLVYFSKQSRALHSLTYWYLPRARFTFYSSQATGWGSMTTSIASSPFMQFLGSKSTDL